MSGQRLPSPDWQVRLALEAAREVGLPFARAWTYAVQGQICDSYRSARGTATREPRTAHRDPPNLRASTGQKRCAGCRFVEDAASGGQARCTLYDVEIFPGVLWPHRTDDRRQWQLAITTAAGEWRRCYTGEPSPVSAILDAIRLRGQEVALRGDDDQAGEQGHAAA